MHAGDSMIDSSGARALATGATTLTYLWEVANKPVSVLMNLRMADRLDGEANEAIHSLSAHGSEIGGVLLGTVAARDRTLVTVDDYLRISCDYSRGPLYQLGQADFDRFDRAIATRQSEGDRLQVVGFFRSHTRKELELSGDDIAFCRSRFGKPHQIALLVRPQSSGPSRAGIFIWEGCVMRGDATYLEFPLSSSELFKRGLAKYIPRVPIGSPITEKRPEPMAPPPPKPAAAPEPPKRAQVLEFVTRREIPQTPPAPVVKAAPIAPRANRDKIQARVGRCCVKVQLRASPSRAAGSKSISDSGFGPALAED
jgi:hypothetical protein